VDDVAERSELAGDLEADAAVGSGHHGDRLVGDHRSSENVSATSSPKACWRTIGSKYSRNRTMRPRATWNRPR
jgi:hypothetical protein